MVHRSASNHGNIIANRAGLGAVDTGGDETRSKARGQPGAGDFFGCIGAQLGTLQRNGNVLDERTCSVL